MHRPTIALLTDFGISDPYAGVLRGVIATIAPEARVIDLSHAIPRGDVRKAAHALWQATPYLPQGTILLCVVDPGVGSERSAVALAWPSYRYVGPDNGSVSYLIARDGVPAGHRLEEPSFRLEEVSNTFHGRDLFAPGAAYLATGITIEEFGPPVKGLVQLSPPRLELRRENEVVGEVIHADPFGNLITSLGILAQGAAAKSSTAPPLTWLRPWLDQTSEIRLPAERLALILPNGQEIPLRETFADVPEGDPVAYVGSDGLVEIGVNKGDASQRLSLFPGDEVVLTAQG